MVLDPVQFLWINCRFVSVLCLIEDEVRTDEAVLLPLKFPLAQCRKACIDLQELAERRGMRSVSESRDEFRQLG